MPWGLPYEIVLGAHIIALFWNIALVILADINAALWVIGSREKLSERFLTVVHWSLIAGLSVSIVTGLLLFSTVSGYLLQQPAFWIKSAFVLTLIINAFVIHRHAHLAATHTFASLTSAERIPLYISGVVSTGSWVGVIIAAQFLGL